MKKNKELAKECFDYYLTESLGLHPWWTAGEHPPDYYLQVGGIRLALQIGVLNGRPDTHEPPAFDLQHEPPHEIDRQQQLANSIAKRAKASGKKGSYWITFRLWSPAGQRAAELYTQERAMQYIEDTQGRPEPLSCWISIDGMPACRIGKFATETVGVYVARLPSLDSAQRGARLCEAIRVIREASRSTRRGFIQSAPAKLRMPAVLLLLDRWPHGGKIIYGRSMRELPLAERRDWVFVVEESKKGYFPLQEHESRWRRLAGNGETLRHLSAGRTGNTLV
jgi:hypothetical protein